MMKTIALAANYAYINNIETTIKSIIYHNRVVKIYVFNYDILIPLFNILILLALIHLIKFFSLL